MRKLRRLRKQRALLSLRSIAPGIAAGEQGDAASYSGTLYDSRLLKRLNGSRKHSDAAR
jgi:hypothetical protein